MQNLKYYLPGSVLILIAIMIVVVPEILLAFVAALIIMLGIGASGRSVDSLRVQNIYSPVMNPPYAEKHSLEIQ